jgi:MoxR-like ATPase
MEEEESHGHPRDGGRVKENIGQVIVGKDEVIELALVALLGGLQQ